MIKFSICKLLSDRDKKTGEEMEEGVRNVCWLEHTSIIKLNDKKVMKKTRVIPSP